MAPNIKHVSFIAQQLTSAHVIRSKDVDYQAPSPVVDSAAYWEWPAQPANDLSVEHIESNLIYAASQLNGASVLNAENDSYWAEENAHDVEEQHDELQTLGPQQQIDSNDYWAEASYDATSSDEYWNTESTITRITIRNPNLVEAESASYWQEKSHGRTDSDAYWQEALPSRNYWTWNVAAKTESDNYWNWASSVPAT